jgi:hypothetical protein
MRISLAPGIVRLDICGQYSIYKYFKLPEQPLMRFKLKQFKKSIKKEDIKYANYQISKKPEELFRNHLQFTYTDPNDPD